MKRKINKYKFLLGLAFFIICGSYFILDIIKSDNLKKKLYDNYPPLTRVDKLENYVTERYEGKNDGLRHSPGITFITLNNNAKFRVWAEYNKENNLGINEFLKIGDLILKKSNSDSIYIEKQFDTLKIKHVFILINK